MKKLLLASVFSAGMALPAFAQMADDVTCADFMAMAADAQMEAVSMMAGDAMGSDDMAEDDMMAEDEMAEDDMMAEDEMAEDEMAEDDMGSDDMMAEEVSVEAATAACGDHPDMTVHDAMAAGSM